MAGVASDSSYCTFVHSYVQITVTTSNTSLASLVTTAGGSIPSGSTLAFITPETGVVRYRCDGTAPTSSVGQPIQVNQSWPVQGYQSILNCNLIAAANTTVSIEFRG